LNKEKGWNVPIHVDAASGGFIAPFLYPELVWDFRLPLVRSINVSGHKYGLVVSVVCKLKNNNTEMERKYPGVGWVVWKSQKDLPEGTYIDIHWNERKKMNDVIVL